MEKTLAKGDLPKFIELLRNLGYEVFGPKQKEGVLVLDRVENGVELDLPLTMLPPKKLFFPPREILYSYERVEGRVVLQDPLESLSKPLAVIGIRPCDLNGLLILDRVFKGEFKDPFYLERRERAFLACFHCREPAEYCFCDAMGAGPSIEKGYDLLATDLGDRYFFRSGSEAGERVLKDEVFKDALEEDRAQAQAELERLKSKLRSGLNIRGLAERIKTKFWSRFWDERTSKCVLCGACNLVCPTCYCFTVVDETDFTGEKGKRVRVWDPCHFKGFALIAGGLNFRGDRISRIKLRIYHKLCYSVEQRGTYDCVGCGRCIEYCPAHIDLREIIKGVMA